MNGLTKMKIAFLGWGSLIWDQRILKTKGGWHNDGPLLPIEFARISNDGRITLVLHPRVKTSQALWIWANFSNLDEAIENLCKREETNEGRIGYVSITDKQNRRLVAPSIIKEISAWARKKDIQAVVWTNLPSNFTEKLEKPFNLENTIEYLLELKENSPEKYKKAVEYIKKTPVQVQTNNRQQIEEVL